VDPTLSTYRQKQAQETMDVLADMRGFEYMVDTILAYLQSPSFFLWWFGTLGVYVGYKVWKNAGRGKEERQR
jgi:hypothetical protein